MHNQEQRVKEILEQSEAFLDGHFEFNSGKHGEQYINKDAIYPNTSYTQELCRYMSESFKDQEIDTVLGPAMGGVILAQRVAEYLSEIKGKTVYGVYADKDGDNLVIKRGYDNFVDGKNVLVVEDILNTGGSAKKAIDVVKENGGNVVALSALVNRGGVKSKDVSDTEIHSLLEVDMNSWEKEDCPLCQKGIPLDTNVGHAKK